MERSGLAVERKTLNPGSLGSNRLCCHFLKFRQCHSSLYINRYLAMDSGENVRSSSIRTIIVG